MRISNCKRCGKLFTSETNLVCMSCIEEEEEVFGKIKEFLIENPLATVFHVSTSLNISINTIKRYLREGRLEIIQRENQNNVFLTCKSCGLSISSGYYCESCATSIHHDYKSVAIEPDKKQSDRARRSTLTYSNKR